MSGRVGADACPTGGVLSCGRVWERTFRRIHNTGCHLHEQCSS